MRFTVRIQPISNSHPDKMQCILGFDMKSHSQNQYIQFGFYMLKTHFPVPFPLSSHQVVAVVSMPNSVLGQPAKPSQQQQCETDERNLWFMVCPM